MGKHSKTSTEIFIITKITLTYLWFDFPKNCDKDSLCPPKYLILQNKVTILLNTAPPPAPTVPTGIGKNR